MGPASLPRAGWLAVGVAAAAAANAVGGGTGIGWALVAGTVAVALASVVPALRRGSRRVPLVACGAGMVLLALRVLAGPAPAPLPVLPAGGGPWTAVVESVGSPRDGDQVARLRLRTLDGDVVVAATLPSFPTIASGALVEVDGRLRPPPDDDGYGEYLRRTGASGSLDARQLRVVEASPLSLQRFRDSAGDSLRLALPEPEAGLAAGILIGLRERVDRALAADFATAGVSHVVAISGWNIAIVAGLVGAVLRGRPRRVVTVAILGTVLAYVVAAGASPSVVRAAVMACVVLLSRESGRAGRAPAALGAAAAILLLADPALIGDAGFRLSVLATAGLLAWANPLAARLGRIGGGRMPRWLADSLGISLAAQAATLPDVLATFGRLSLIAPVVNLAVVPLVPVAMAGGVLALAGGLATMAGGPTLMATVAGLPGWLVLHVIVGLVRIGAAVPAAAVALPPGTAQPAGLVAAAAILAVPWASGRRRRSRLPRKVAPATTARSRARPSPSRSPARRLTLVAMAIAVGLSALALVDAGGRRARIVVLDIGQGDAILVESAAGSRMLVDGGPDPERLLLQLDARIPPWDRRIDVIVLSHPHEDHVAGLVRVLERYRVGRVYEPGMRGPGPGWAAWDEALRRGPPRGTLAAGATIRLDEIRLTTVWPLPGSVPTAPGATGRIINDTSIMLLGEANGRRFLLTGDAEDDVDPALVARGLPRLDVLKVAHHGSATATSAAFLAATRPRIAVISVGEGNDYGHPREETLGRLRDVGATVFRTDRNGTIEIALGRDAVTVRPARSDAGDRATGYDRGHDDPRSPRGRPVAALAGAAAVVPAPRVRRGGRVGLAGGPERGRWAGRGRGARRGRGAAPRRGQAAIRTGAGPPSPRGRRGGLARGTRDGRARPGGP